MCPDYHKLYHQNLTDITQPFDITDIENEEALDQSQFDQFLCRPIPSDTILSRSTSCAETARLGQTESMGFQVADRRSPIERLPAEIWDMIMPHLAIKTSSNGYIPRNRDLKSCLLVSRTFHYYTLQTLFAHVTFSHSLVFSKFLSHIQKYEGLGELVRRLDFSPFTSVGLGRTMRMNYEIRRLTSTTLRKCLELTPRVREFLASEPIGMDMDSGVLQKLFCELPMLETLDFCSLSDKGFVEGMAKVLTPSNPALPDELPIKRLGLHACTTVQMSCISTLLPRLPMLTHLDLTHTQVTDAMLHSIPATAKLTHLSLSKCNRLKGAAVVDFILNHPSAKNLIYLNLLYETSSYRLLSASDVDKLLPNLPKTLKSLNLSGAKITRDHVPNLRALAKHLEELSIGYADLALEDICTTLAPGYEGDDEKKGQANEKPVLAKHTVHYLDLTGISSINPSGLLYVQNCPLLLPSTFPLQAVELSEKIISGLNDRKVACSKVGWKVKDQGCRRAWLVRAEAGVHPGGEDAAKKSLADDGSRTWKMGGKWWGNRKVGCAQGEISGLYNYYGFKK